MPFKVSIHVRGFVYGLLLATLSCCLALSENSTMYDKLYWPQYLRMISRNGNISTNIEEMGPSILAYPALQIHEAIQDGNISVKLSDVSMLSPHYMSYAQGRVLLQGLLQNVTDNTNFSKTELGEFITKYFFSFPSKGIIISQHKEKDYEIENMEDLLDYYTKLLPSQRYALLWALMQKDPAKFEDILAVLSKHDTSPQMEDQQKPYSLLRLASPKVFNKYTRMFKGLELHHQEKFIDAIREWLFYGTLCHNVEKIDTLEIFSLIHSFNIISSQSIPSEVTPLRLGYRKCLVDKIKLYTELKRQLPNYNSTNNVLSSSQIMDIGGPILTGININEVLSYVANDTEALDTWRNEIGKIPFPELMALYGNNVAETAEWYYNKRSMPVNEILSNMGNLAFFMPNYVLEKIDQHSIRTFIENQIVPKSSQNCFCLTKESRNIWASMVKRAYGPVEKWTSAVLIEIGNLLWVLDDSDFKLMNQNEFVRATPVLLKNTCLGGKLKLNSFPGRYGVASFSDACTLWLEDENITEFENAEKVFLRKLLVNSQLLVNQALVNIQKNNETSEINAEPQTYEDEFNSTEVKNFFELTKTLVRKSWESNTMKQTERLEFGTVIDKISEDHKTGLANIFGVDASELPKDSQKFKEYYEQQVKERVLSENQKIEIEKLATYNKVQYIKEMIGIFGFNEKDYDIDRKIFCNYAACLEIQKDIVDKDTKPDGPKIEHPEDIKIWVDTEGINEPSEFSCNGIVAAGVSAQALSVDDIKEWQAAQLFNCIDVFGRVNWSYDTKKSIWNLLKDRTGTRIMNENNLKEEVALFLNEMLEVVAIENLDILDLKSNFSTDIVSILGQKHLDQNTVEHVAHKYMKAHALNETSIYTEDAILEFASLGEIICGLPTDTVSKYVSSMNGRKLDLLSLFGLNVKQCRNSETLKMLATKFNDQSGGNWTPENVETLGVVISGLKPESLSNLLPESLASITPSAMHQLTPSHFESLTAANKLKYIPMEFALNANDLRRQLLESIPIDNRNDTVELLPEELATDSAQPIWKSWELWVGVGIGLIVLIVVFIIIIKCACKTKTTRETNEENPPIPLQAKSDKS